jgi:hypothetical protein
MLLPPLFDEKAWKKMLPHLSPKQALNAASRMPTTSSFPYQSLMPSRPGKSILNDLP